MSDGRPTPPAHDGMAAFRDSGKVSGWSAITRYAGPAPRSAPSPRRTIRRRPAARRRFIFYLRHPDAVISFASLSGTSTNCAGGAYALALVAHVRGDDDAARPRRTATCSRCPSQGERCRGRHRVEGDGALRLTKPSRSTRAPTTSTRPRIRARPGFYRFIPRGGTTSERVACRCGDRGMAAVMTRRSGQVAGTEPRLRGGGGRVI